MSKKKMDFKDYIVLQVSVLIYSISSVFSKYASNEEFLSTRYLIFMIIMMVTLGIYAIIYQQILKKVPLNFAFANKGATIIWSVLIGVALFNEQVTTTNIIGAILVVLGIIVISTGEINE